VKLYNQLQLEQVGWELRCSKWSFIKARRSFIRNKRWTDAQWYVAWPQLAEAWEYWAQKGSDD
jgi:hypothetical protein